jgi:molybdenum cofactor guanylyltransferase
MNTSAIILCGGKATRMGGEDKGLISYRGKPLVQHVVERITPQVDDIVLSANRNPDRYKNFSDCVVADINQDYAGPLAGIASCLPHCVHEQVLVIAGDMPLLPADLVERLATAMTNHQIAVACCEQRSQLAFILKRDLLESINQSLHCGDYRLMRWVESHNPCHVQYDNCNDFANINSRDDLLQLS